jgi:23S rRNA (adenine2503-C2)-methyltransferase
MPGVAGVALERLREALAAYEKATGRRPTLEYALIADVNDSSPELEALLAFCRGLHCHVNIIPANAVEGTRYGRGSDRTAAAFVRALADSGVEASVRVERGADIDAACGQLRQRVSAEEE